MDKNKKEFKSWIILSASFCFMFFVYAPLEVYLTNVQEFWFCIKNLLPIIAVCFLLAGILFISAGLFLRKTKIFPYMLSVFFCIYIGLYIQGNFIPRNYGVLDGKDIDWGKYSHYGIMAAVLWGIMLVTCIALCWKLLKNVHIISTYVGTIVSLILVVTSATLFIQNIHYEKDKNSVVVSQKSILSLSDKKNFIVFLYDAFSSSFVGEILESEDGAEYREMIKDFIYYPDAVGGYPTTKASMPFILTGQWYENEKPYADYVREAYYDTDFYDFLKQNQYNVGVYTTGTFLSDNTDIYINAENGAYALTNVSGFAKDIYKLVGFNYLPHQLKKYAQVYSGDFDQYAKSTSEDKAYSIMDVPEFTNLVKKDGISVEEKENAFRFYHLYGTHPFYEFGENLQKDGKDYTAIDEAKGCIQSLKYFCDMLKEADVYDDSIIVVMADHGHNSDAFKGSNPVFMIKDRQTESSEFQISDISVSWEDLIPTMKTLISGKEHQGDIWSFDTGVERKRRFLEYTWDDSWEAESLPEMTEYEAVGSTTDDTFALLPTSAVFQYAGSEHREDEDDIHAVDGREVVQVHDEKWENFSLSGVSDLEINANEEAFRWTSEQESMFRFTLKDTDKNCRVTLNYLFACQENSTDNIKAKINGKELSNENINVGDNQVFIDVPNDFISEKDLSLVVEFPNAISPKQLGNGDDDRKLALALSGLSIERYTYKNELSDSFVLEDGMEISVDDTVWDQFLLQGMGGIEFMEDHHPFRWSTDQKVKFNFLVNDISCEGYKFMISYWMKNREEALDGIYAECNGQKIDVDVNAENQLEIYIPCSYIEDHEGKLTVYLPNAISPKALGKSEDDRTLCVAVTGVKIEKYESGN